MFIEIWMNNNRDCFAFARYFHGLTWACSNSLVKGVTSLRNVETEHVSSPTTTPEEIPEETEKRRLFSEPAPSWWRVMDSNHRRLRRRIYSPLPLAARATRHFYLFLPDLSGKGAKITQRPCPTPNRAQLVRIHAVFRRVCVPVGGLRTSESSQIRRADSFSFQSCPTTSLSARLMAIHRREQG